MKLAWRKATGSWKQNRGRKSLLHTKQICMPLFCQSSVDMKVYMARQKHSPQQSLADNSSMVEVDSILCECWTFVIIYFASFIIIIIIERVWFMWHRLNSYKTVKTTLQCHNESHSNSSSSHVQLELYHTSGKLREKSSVLNSCLKAGRVVDEITSTGRAFQTCATMTGKARSPTVDSRNIGTAKMSNTMTIIAASAIFISVWIIMRKPL